ncbi:hypothetical protein CVS52_11615 [Staphylococcus epidermidis]|nr:hypothetical protein CVS52_11615 [Staphylococcus epidermidis]
MYKNYHMTKHTLPMETSVIISTHDMSQYVNDIVKKFQVLNSDSIVAQHYSIPKYIKNNIICLHKFYQL